MKSSHFCYRTDSPSTLHASSLLLTKTNSLNSNLCSGDLHRTLPISPWWPLQQQGLGHQTLGLPTVTSACQLVLTSPKVKMLMGRIWPQSRASAWQHEQGQSSGCPSHASSTSKGTAHAPIASGQARAGLDVICPINHDLGGKKNLEMAISAHHVVTECQSHQSIFRQQRRQIWRSRVSTLHHVAVVHR